MLKFVTIITIIFCLSLSTALSFSGNGSGTEADPYQITNVHQLQEMEDDLAAHYILMNDIDASETREWNHKGGWEPIGGYVHSFAGISFTGTLDGCNFSINNLFINRPSRMYVGLFECICNGAVVKNLLIKNADITAAEEAGILVGRIYVFDTFSEVNIENCSVSGKVSFQYLQGSIFGGLCGSIYAEYGTSRIYHCYSEADVISDDAAGGFCGINESINGTSIIEECYSTGVVNCNEYFGNYMGGFCGINKSWRGESHILNCFSTGNVAQRGLSRGVCFGGFCGLNVTFSIDNPGHSIIENCYSLGRVNGYIDLGGFCGRNVGDGINRISDSYFCYQTSYLDSSKGGKGKTIAAMMMQSTFENWDFDNVWCMVEGKTYPQLQYFVDCDKLVSVPDTELNSEIILYPNPTDNALYIEFDSGFIHSPEIAIYSQLGQVVFSDPSADITQPYKVNTGTFPPGIYFCKVSGIGISEVRSFVVYR
jgi:hypothetical protein